MDREAILQGEAEAQLRREADQRRFIYRDVEALIEGEFLYHSLAIVGVPVTLRTLLPDETHRLRARISSAISFQEALRWKVAMSIWILNGFEISRNPNEAWHLYQEWVRDLPSPLIAVLDATISGLQNRMDRAVRITEAFCYERYSRATWRMMGRPQDTANANPVKRLWVAYNLTEDQEVEAERQWSHTRAIVGSMTNKGAKHITQELNKFEEREKKRRQGVIEEAVNWVIRGEEEKEPLKVVVGGKELEVRQVYSPTSAEDLEEEMRRVFSGEEDWHDYMVNRYQKGIRDRVHQKREEYQRKVMEARRRSEEAEERGQQPLVGYTKEQLEQLGGVGQRTTATLPTSVQSNYMFDRYFDPTMKPGVLTPGLKVEDPSAQDAHRLGKQEEEGVDQPSLQERIAKRKPKLGEP